MLDGRPVERGSRRIGYIPQQKTFDPDTPLRARDLVGLGVDGHRWGVRLGAGGANRKLSGCWSSWAPGCTTVRSPVGGEQQRLRIAQASRRTRGLLWTIRCFVDLQHQQAVTELLGGRRRQRKTAVVFVTHEINPVMGYVDRVLYLPGAASGWEAQEVFTAEVLTALYGSRVEVIHANGRMVVVGPSRMPPPTIARGRARYRWEMGWVKWTACSASIFDLQREFGETPSLVQNSIFWAGAGEYGMLGEL